MRRLHIGILVILSCVLFLLALTLVSAASAGEVSSKIIEGITNVLEPIFEIILGDAPSSEFFFAKSLIVILIVSIAYAALSASGVSAITDRQWVLWTVSVIVAILGVRFLTPELVETIALPSSAFAVAVSAGIPFVLFFIMIRGFPPFGKRLAWVFFAVIFLGLWALRYDELGDAAFIYPVTAAIAIIMIFIEGIIQKYAMESRRKRAAAGFKGVALKDLEDKLETARLNFAKNGSAYTGMIDPNHSGEAALKEDVREFERRIRTLMRS